MFRFILCKPMISQYALKIGWWEEKKVEQKCLLLIKHGCKKNCVKLGYLFKIVTV